MQFVAAGSTVHRPEVIVKYTEVPCNCRRPTAAGGGGGSCGGEGGRRHVFVHTTILFGGAGEGGGHVPQETGHRVRAMG